MEETLHYDGGLISVIHKEFKNLNENSSNPCNMCANEMERLFIRDEVQMARKDMRKMFSLTSHWSNCNSNTEIPSHPSVGGSRFNGVCTFQGRGVWIKKIR